ncbi:hypothetical protein IP88_13405 [alpha proteobacterium AAP81b]|nr:hypothetical protein IP88_13405 [alpha proteobacterium AAP81b]
MALLALGWAAGRLPSALADGRELAGAWRLPVALAPAPSPVAIAPPPPTYDSLPLIWGWPPLLPAFPAPDPPEARPPAQIDPERTFFLPVLPIDYRLPPAPLFATTSGNPAAPIRAPAPEAPPSPEAFALASEAYARLAAGDRRGAAAGFDAALAAGPHPNAPVWAAQAKQLRKRWSNDIYSLFRAPGPVSAAAAPVLGGGQTGVTVAWTANPLNRRPIAVVLRSTAAIDDPAATGQAALGVRWQLLPGLAINAERLFALGPFATDGWTARLSGGAQGNRGRLQWQAYGEAGVIDDGSFYGGAEARAHTPLLRFGKSQVFAGGGAWGGGQTGFDPAWRVDVGPSLLLRRPLFGGNLSVAADWRFRVGGNAFPDSGPALTVATSF